VVRGLRGVWPNRDECRAGERAMSADTAVTACHQGYYDIALTTVGTAAAVSRYAARPRQHGSRV